MAYNKRFQLLRNPVSPLTGFPTRIPALTEADTCRRYVLPKLYTAGWTDEQISEQKTFTDGRIVLAGDKPRRRPQKRAFRVRLWDQQDLTEQLFAYYDKLDEDIRAELPLKRIWTIATNSEE